MRPAARRPISASRRGLGSGARLARALTPSTIIGTTLSSVSEFENERTIQTSQYDCPWSSDITAASANDDSSGAASPADPMKTATLRNVLNSVGAALKKRTPPAASSASRELVRNNATTVRGG